MVRPATIGDAAEIARVNVATWRSAYRNLLPDDFLAALTEANYAERWTRLIGEGSGRVFVAEEPDGIVGFASGGRERAGEHGLAGERYADYVLDSAEGRGPRAHMVRTVAGPPREIDFPKKIV